MGTQQTQQFCQPCGEGTLHTRLTPCPHLIHFLLTLITCGGWWIVWLIHFVVVGNSEPWRCSKCGSDPLALAPAELQNLHRAKAADAEENAARCAELRRLRRAQTAATMRDLGTAAATLWLVTRRCVAAMVAFLFSIPPWIDRTLWRILGRENGILVRFTEIQIAIATVAVIGLLAAVAWTLLGQLAGAM